MQNPEKELKEYLGRLVQNFIYLKSLYKQISLYLDWRKSKGLEGIEHSSHFFNLFFYSAKRTLCLDTYKLISTRESRGILDWLNKAEIHFNSLNPSIYVGWSEKRKSERRSLTKKEYQEIIHQQIDELNHHQEVIDNITAMRDKGFTHTEPKYFNNPDLLEHDYPINWELLENLFLTISQVLRKHYSLINNSDMSMELVTGSDIDTIINRSRGFERIWRNKKLNELGLKKYVFLRDDYDEDNIYLN